MSRIRTIALLLVAFTGWLNGGQAPPRQGAMSNRASQAGAKGLSRESMSPSEFTKHANIALLVGIGDYNRQLTGLGPLKYTVSDIVGVAEVLKQQGYQVRMLTDRAATAGAIMNSFRELTAALDQGEGTFLFYFSGHGFRVDNENYLATFGVTTSDLKQGVSLSKIQELLLATGARRRLAFIDACRNDPGARGADLKSFEYLKQSEGLRILYSTAPGSVSYEDENLEHGVFSNFIIKGLRGEATAGDGYVTFDSLQQYVTSQMLRYGVPLGRVQKPYQLGESTGDFIVVTVPSRPAKASQPLPPPDSSAAPTRRATIPDDMLHKVLINGTKMVGETVEVYAEVNYNQGSGHARLVATTEDHAYVLGFLDSASPEARGFLLTQCSEKCVAYVTGIVLNVGVPTLRVLDISATPKPNAARRPDPKGDLSCMVPAERAAYLPNGNGAANPIQEAANNGSHEKVRKIGSFLQRAAPIQVIPSSNPRPSSNSSVPVAAPGRGLNYRSVTDTPLSCLLARHPYEDANTLWPRIAFTILSMPQGAEAPQEAVDENHCWTLRAKIWYSGSDSEDVEPFQWCGVELPSKGVSTSTIQQWGLNSSSAMTLFGMMNQTYHAGSRTEGPDYPGTGLPTDSVHIGWFGHTENAAAVGGIFYRMGKLVSPEDGRVWFNIADDLRITR